MAVATVSDVATSLGRSISEPTEVEQVEQWLADAELQIRLRLGDVAALDQAAVAFVEREAVVMRLRNPEGYQSESIEDYTYRWGNERGRVAILPEWWEMLSPSADAGAFTIRPSYVPDDPASMNAWRATQ